MVWGACPRGDRPRNAGGKAGGMQRSNRLSVLEPGGQFGQRGALVAQHALAALGRPGIEALAALGAQFACVPVPVGTGIMVSCSGACAAAVTP
ncbi:hypothetical protein L571_0357 [Bordetella pertussis 2371640]|nr:hypothetical protein L571_0357 [Bordetella pertussis 2371640]